MCWKQRTVSVPFVRAIGLCWFTLSIAVCFKIRSFLTHRSVYQRCFNTSCTDSYEERRYSIYFVNVFFCQLVLHLVCEVMFFVFGVGLNEHKEAAYWVFERLLFDTGPTYFLTEMWRSTTTEEMLLRKEANIENIVRCCNRKPTNCWTCLSHDVYFPLHCALSKFWSVWTSAVFADVMIAICEQLLLRADIVVKINIWVI
jgi:hypothetical protein